MDATAVLTIVLLSGAAGLVTVLRVAQWRRAGDESARADVCTAAVILPGLGLPVRQRY